MALVRVATVRRVRPADVGSLDQPVDEQEHAARAEQRTRRVEVGEWRAFALAGEQRQRGGEREQAHRDVHEEHPPPAWSLRQDPAEEHPRGGAETADRTPRAERGVPVGPLAEGGGEDRQRGWCHHRSADALEHASGDQRALALGKPGCERAGGESDEAGDEHPPTAEQVSEPAAEQEEASVRQQVAARDPLQVLLREMQSMLDRGEGHVRDRGIDHIQKLDATEQ